MRYNAYKSFLNYIPETFLFAGIVILLIVEWVQTSGVSYTMILSGAILCMLIITSNKWLALVIAFILGSLSCYMLLAVLSEYHEFPSGDKDGYYLLATGILIFGFLLILSILLPLKYLQKK